MGFTVSKVPQAQIIFQKLYCICHRRYWHPISWSQSRRLSIFWSPGWNKGRLGCPFYCRFLGEGGLIRCRIGLSVKYPHWTFYVFLCIQNLWQRFYRHYHRTVQLWYRSRNPGGFCTISWIKRFGDPRFWKSGLCLCLRYIGCWGTPVLCRLDLDGSDLP